MANQEHVDLLKQGAETWNVWRPKHPDVLPDLTEANLSGAYLIRADLSHANLVDANLSRAYLVNATLKGSNLTGANLAGSNLTGINLNGANLSGASLSGADLIDANLNRAGLSRADLSLARAGWTIFCGLDLRSVKGLETLRHIGPSAVGMDTILRSRGDIPEVFLRGTGLDDTSISYVLSLAKQPIQHYSCFISYSSRDQAFAKLLYNDLQASGVRCWFAPEDLKTGDKFRERIDESIHFSDKLLLVLSEHSVASPWVEKEVETAFEKEHRTGHLVLFPVKLDESVMQTHRAWAADIRRMRHILDFADWKEHDAYQYRLARLLHDLKART